MKLELDITDPTLTEYFSQYDEAQQNEKALEALRIGVTAIRSATVTLDTKIVEQKFQEVEQTLQNHLTEFEKQMQTELEAYFKDEGKVATTLNGLLNNQLGAGSEFKKSLDPEHQSSVVTYIKTTVEEKLNGSTEKITAEFSLDNDLSALSRLRKAIDEKINNLNEANQKFLKELSGQLGIQTGQESEAQKGTQKGRDFESALYEKVAELGRNLGDTTDNVTGTVGSTPRAKVGDFVITLGETTAAPGKRIVIEAKDRQNFKLKDAIEELNSAKDNRAADIGIFAFAKGTEPPEVGDFHQIGTDFFVTIEKEHLHTQTPLLFLEAAYKISRARLVTSVRNSEDAEIDFEQIKIEIESAINALKDLDDIATKAKTIRNSAVKIEEMLDKQKPSIQTSLNKITTLLSLPK